MVQPRDFCRRGLHSPRVLVLILMVSAFFAYLGMERILTSQSYRPSSLEVSRTLTAIPPAVRWVGKSILDPLEVERNEYLQLIEAVMSDCSLNGTEAKLGFGGGFASRFQYLSASLMQAVFTGKRAAVFGHYGSYSQTPYCDEVLGWRHMKLESHTCFFLPPSECWFGNAREKQHLAEKEQKEAKEEAERKARARRKRRSRRKAARSRIQRISDWLFGSPRDFREFVEDQQAEQMVRQTAADNRAKAAASKEAKVVLGKMSRSLFDNETGRLFEAAETWLFRMTPATASAMREREKKVGFTGQVDRPLVGLHIRRGDKATDKYNRYHTIREYVRPVYSYALKAPFCKPGNETSIQVYVASDSPSALEEVREFLKDVRANDCSFEVIGASGTTTQAHTTSSAQQTEDGQYAALSGLLKSMSPKEQMEATFDILFDIHMLSRALLLVGTFCSQVGRLARGLQVMLNYPDALGPPPVALDFVQLERAKDFTARGLPFLGTEGWVSHPVWDNAYDHAPGAVPVRPLALSWDYEEAYQAILTLQSNCSTPLRSTTPTPTPTAGWVDSGNRGKSSLEEVIRSTAASALRDFREGYRVDVSHVLHPFSPLACEDPDPSQHCLFPPKSRCQDSTASASASAAPDNPEIPERPEDPENSETPEPRSKPKPKPNSKLSWANARATLQKIPGLELLAVVEAWLLELSEEGLANLISRPLYARRKLERPPSIGLRVGRRANLSSYEMYIEAIVSWSKDSPLVAEKREAGSASRAVPCLVLVTDDVDFTLFSKQLNDSSAAVSGPCRFEPIPLPVRTPPKHDPERLAQTEAFVEKLFLLHMLSTTERFVSSSDDCDPLDLLVAGLRRARAGRGADPNSFRLHGSGLEPVQCEEELWSKAPIG